MMSIVLTVAMRKLSVEPQQDKAGVGNSIVPKVENQAETKNADIPHRKPDGWPKVDQNRSGMVGHSPQGLGITEKQ